MSDDPLRPVPPCWCGNTDLADFSPTYAACPHCGALVSRQGLTAADVEVKDDGHDFYGKNYWLSRQRDELGFPDIFERAHGDMPERCVYWLRSLLGSVAPPATVLEVGSGHGGYVALLRAAGFDATGLELSPWVVNFARTTFGIPMLHGRIEDQDLPDASMDVIVLNDVLEHLVNPLASLRRCVSLLRPQGFLVIQTPCYPEPRSYQELVDATHPFLAMLQEKEHLHLFSERAVRRLLDEAGLVATRFEPALFPYDMFLFAGRGALPCTTPAEREEALARSPAARLVRALLDLDDRARALSTQVADIERDRQERIDMIQRLNEHIAQTSLDYEARLRVIHDQQAMLEALRQEEARLREEAGAHARTIEEQAQAIAELRREWATLPVYQRLADEQAGMLAVLREQASRAAADAEERWRTMASQQATIATLVEQARQAAAAGEARLQALEQRLAGMDRFSRAPIVRLLRLLRLL